MADLNVRIDKGGRIGDNVKRECFVGSVGNVQVTFATIKKEEWYSIANDYYKDGRE